MDSYQIAPLPNPNSGFATDRSACNFWCNQRVVACMVDTSKKNASMVLLIFCHHFFWPSLLLFPRSVPNDTSSTQTLAANNCKSHHLLHKLFGNPLTQSGVSLTVSPFSKLGKKGDMPAGSCIVSFVPHQSEFTLVLLDADTASPSFLPSWILLPTVLCFGMWATQLDDYQLIRFQFYQGKRDASRLVPILALF